jgi:hypothetical protein
MRMILALALLGAGATGCNRESAGVVRNSVQFPADAAIAAALADNFKQDPNTAQARVLLGTLGGERGQLDYRVRNVVSRNGSFEAHYDVTLKLGQTGTESLQKLYGTMVPASESNKWPAQDLAAHERWLTAQAQQLEKTDAPQATALRKTIQTLSNCYRDAKAGDEILLMERLAALVSPSRDGWYAEKLSSPTMTVRCLPF